MIDRKTTQVLAKTLHLNYLHVLQLQYIRVESAVVIGNKKTL